MPDKIAPGAVHESDVVLDYEEQRREAELERLRKRRDSATWYVIVGIGMLFAGSISVGFAIGGVLMVLYGAATYILHARRMGRLHDPWEDEELDAWEREHFDEDP